MIIFYKFRHTLDESSPVKNGLVTNTLNTEFMTTSIDQKVHQHSEGDDHSSHLKLGDMGTSNDEADTNQSAVKHADDSSASKTKAKRPWDLDNFRNLGYPSIAVSPRYHMVIDRPIENDKDSRKLFV